MKLFWVIKHYRYIEGSDYGYMPDSHLVQAGFFYETDALKFVEEDMERERVGIKLQELTREPLSEYVWRVIDGDNVWETEWEIKPVPMDPDAIDRIANACKDDRFVTTCVSSQRVRHA